jgi:hypothetical protein
MNYQIWTLMVAVGFNAAVRYDPVFFFLKHCFYSHDRFTSFQMFAIH